MEYVIGILLLLSFFVLAVYCIKGYNLMIGLLGITVFWTLLPIVGHFTVTNPEFLAAHPEVAELSIISIINDAFQAGPEAWGTTLVNVLWGAWFGRVLLETGVSATIIRKTVELGGDRPVVTMALLNIVTAVIFTSMSGAGPVNRDRRDCASDHDQPRHSQIDRAVLLYGVGGRRHLSESGDLYAVPRVLP